MAVSVVVRVGEKVGVLVAVEVNVDVGVKVEVVPPEVQAGWVNPINQG